MDYCLAIMPKYHSNQGTLLHQGKNNDDKASDALHVISSKRHHAHYAQAKAKCIYLETLPFSNGRIINVPNQTRVLYLHKINV